MKYAIVDFECTCWNREDPNKDLHEIIEIGAVFLDENFKKVNDVDIFVTPKHNKTLSEYCIALTGITQKILDSSGILFPNAINILNKYITPDTVFCSWGEFDKTQLIQDCKEWRVPYPFTDGHINIKKEFMEKFNRKKCGLQKACRILNLRFNGTPHRAISDALMTAEIFKIIREQKEKKE